MGDHATVGLHGHRPESNLIFTQKVVDIGPVPVGTPQKATAVIRNIGESDAMFQASPAGICLLASRAPHWLLANIGLLLQVLPSDVLTFVPDRARVPKGASLTLEMALSIMSPRAISTNVVLEVHAGKAARLMVKAEAVLPAIEVAEPSYEFGEVSIGATSKLPVTIVNPSPVPAGAWDMCNPGSSAHVT